MATKTVPKPVSKLHVTKAPKAATVTKTAVAPVTENPVDTDIENAVTVDSGDLIVKTVSELLSLKSDKAFNLVPKLLDNIDHDYFRLGGIMQVIQNEGWHMDRGHDSFKSYVEAECNMKYRKAMYLIGIYNALVSSGVKWELVKHLGWSKLKDLAPVLDPDNAADWVAAAESMTGDQLRETIRNSLAGSQAGTNTGDSNVPVSTVTSLVFKLHPDQKETVNQAVEKAKLELGTDAAAVAIEHIAIDFLSGTKKTVTLLQLMKGKSAEEVLQAVVEAFPDVIIKAEIPEA